MTGATGSDRTDRRGAGLVLCVDAEEARQRTVQTALEAAGFVVLLARDGREGAESLRERADEIRVVILDQDLPDRRGDAVLQEMQRLGSMASVLLLGGGTAETVRPRFPAKERVEVFQKPLQIGQLVERVRAACEKRRYARLEVSVPVMAWALDRPGRELRGRVCRVSEGGLEIEFPETVSPGTALRLQLQTRRGPIEVQGKIVSARAMATTVRHGLAFFEPKDFHFVLGLFVHDKK